MRSWIILIALWQGLLLADDTVIRIYPDRVRGKANILVAGHNIEAGDTRGLDHAGTLQWPKPSADMVHFGQGNWDPAKGRPDADALREYREVRCRMLRYPGGCIAHNFDWRKTIGRPEERPDWKFGINEFLLLCKQLRVEPMITLTDYALPAEELPAHCARLVEYLNLPAVPEYPMAMQRARDGYPEPWNVKYFEFGNESFHPNHSVLPFRSFSAQSYAQCAKKVFAAIRAIDPKVKLGAVALNGMNFASAKNPWVETIFRELIGVADFIVIHYYGPRFERLNKEEALESFLTGQSMFRFQLQATRALMRKYAGKTLPIAFSEYNIKAIENAQPHWRHTFLAGLAVSDLLMAMRNAGPEVHSAAYWELIGGYFGAVQRKNGARTYSAVYPFWREYMGTCADTLLEVATQNNPKQSQFAKKLGTVRAAGDRFLPPKQLGSVKNFRFFDPALRDQKIQSKLNQKANYYAFRFRDRQKDAYPAFLGIRRIAGVPQGSGYSLLLRFESRYTPDPQKADTGTFVLGLGLMDARGWNATQCASAETGLQNDAAWTERSISLSVGADCKDIFGLLRLSDFKGSCNGLLEIRNLRGEIIADCTVPAVELLSIEASKDAQGDVVLVGINRSAGKTISAIIEFDGEKIHSATVRQLYQEDVTMRNEFEVPQEQKVVVKGKITHSFPPHSMSVFRLKRTLPVSNGFGNGVQSPEKVPAGNFARKKSKKEGVMKIILFGTGHGDPTLTRNQSFALLVTRGRYYLIDCGEPANTTLVRNHLCASELSGVFITHMHGDHVGGAADAPGTSPKASETIPGRASEHLSPGRESTETAARLVQSASDSITRRRGRLSAQLFKRGFL
ncbi:MAG: MBL fold metallo-hydrolase [Victivallaceae bacterium]|nr:MBL fold metallo-hydrolase [Victivallaceae bacterium]